MDTIDMGRRTRGRATRKATRRGGAELPLITYTPNYKGLGPMIKVTDMEITFDVSMVDDDTYEIPVAISLIIEPPFKDINEPIPISLEGKRFRVHGVLGKEMYKVSREYNTSRKLDEAINEATNKFNKFQERLLKNYRIIFCALMRNVIRQKKSPRMTFELEGTIVDNHGNHWELKPGEEYPELEGRVKSGGVKTFRKDPLPDSLIDWIISYEKDNVETYERRLGNSMTTFYIYPHKPNPNVIPHRKFHPISDYLHILEVCASHDKPVTINRNTQTNTKNKTNSNTQTNRPTKVSMNTQTNRPIGVSMNTQTNVYSNQNRANNNAMVLRSAPNGWANQVIQSAQDRDLVVNSNEETNRNPQTRRSTRVNRNTQRKAPISNNTANIQRQLRNLQNTIVLLSQQMHTRNGR